MGIEINATHHRSARSGLVTGVATLAHGGRTMSTFDIVITDDDGKRVCTARLSCLHRDGVPGGSVHGASVPDGSVPDGSVPGGSAPDASAPGGGSSQA